MPFKSKLIVPPYSDLSVYRLNKGLDWTWIGFPNKLWVHLACAQRNIP